MLNRTKIRHTPADGENCYTVYVLMGICYALIAMTMYMFWQKATWG